MKVKNAKNFKKKLGKRYQLVVREDKTLAEKFRLKLNLANVLIVLSFLFCVGFILSFILITQTPISSLSSEASAIELQKANQKLLRKVDELERQLEKLERKEKELNRILESVEYKNAPIQNPFHFAQIKNGQQLKDEKSMPILKSPLSGIISKSFDPLMEHYGVDLVGKINSPVKAIARGTVVFAGWTPDKGHVLVLQHNSNFVSVYKHNSTKLKKEGNFVQQGETIAINGNSGELSTGPHLHFELWHNGSPQNPEDFVTF
ncbi:MAG: peptidoglycan DD-metalloendopeptidase family protein [Bacteroidota bacterium]|nr:peptidoglycan DD-metalloendopeptidase family protein [Bacteroidota bacterium]